MNGWQKRCTGAGATYDLHRPEHIPRGNLTAVCQYCGKAIRRAHRRSTWWRDDEPSAPAEVFPRATDLGEGAEC